jgi:hypothetical protein
MSEAGMDEQVVGLRFSGLGEASDSREKQHGSALAV